MSEPDWAALRDAANADPEFRLHARFWSSVIRLGFGERLWRLEIRGGELAAVEPWRDALACDLAIAAPERDWAALLEPVPRPFYQDLAAAAAHHGFVIAGDTLHYCAYYPALRRLVELMREVAHGDV